MPCHVLVVKLDDFKKEVYGVWGMRWRLQYRSTSIIFVMDADEK